MSEVYINLQTFHQSAHILTASELLFLQSTSKMLRLCFVLFCLVKLSAAARPYTQEDKDKIVALHNKYRADVRSQIENQVIPCKDVSYQCDSWKHSCESNFGFMLMQCYKTCGFCDEAWRKSGSSRSARSTGACEDTNPKCQQWADDRHCDYSPGYMLKNCKKSCENCAALCEDVEEECQQWAARGECKVNPGYMLRNCQKSCDEREEKKKCKAKATASGSTASGSGLASGSTTSGSAGASSSYKYPDMVWSDTLAQLAERQANGCRYSHLSPNKYGENLAFDGMPGHEKFSAYNQTADAINRWANEKELVHPGWGCYRGGSCLHYTQMIWATTTEVGCAVKHDCPGMRKIQVVCEYNPKGNDGYNGKPRVGMLYP